MKTIKLLILTILVSQNILAQNILPNLKLEAIEGSSKSQMPKKTKITAKNAKTAAVTNMGININNPSYPLEVGSPAGYGLVNTNTTDGTKLGSFLDANAAWFGTISNHPLLFYINDGVTPILSMYQSGNVGINMSSHLPYKKFDLNGSAILSETADTANVQIGVIEPIDAKLVVKNNNFQYGLLVDSPFSQGGNALKVKGTTHLDGRTAISENLAVAGNTTLTNLTAGNTTLTNLNVIGTLSKGGGSFKIDHPLDPENKFLYHSFVESPDMMNIYNGNITTDAQGLASVSLPGYFEALNIDFRYQLTTIGTFAQAIVAEKVKNNSFVIRTDKPNVEVSWQVTGVRNDAYAKKYRIPNSVEKSDEEKGKYLYPAAFK